MFFRSTLRRTETRRRQRRKRSEHDKKNHRTKKGTKGYEEGGKEKRGEDEKEKKDKPGAIGSEKYPVLALTNTVFCFLGFGVGRGVENGVGRLQSS